MERIYRRPSGRGRRPERVDGTTYFKRLQELYPISRIFYPGCWNDRSLEEAFDPSQVFYADNDTWQLKPRRNLVLADMAKAPFKDGSFDAMFYQDADVEVPVFRAALRVVKENGLVVFSTDQCTDGIQLRDLPKVTELTPIELPFNHSYFHTYRKNSR